MGASIIAGDDASPVLDPAKDILDLVALFVEAFVMVALHLSVGAWRDAHSNAAFGQSGSEPVTVKSLVPK